MSGRLRALCAVCVFIGFSTSVFAAPVEEATVPVTLSIEQSCLIRSSNESSQVEPPVVQCEHDEVYSISNVVTDPIAPASVRPAPMRSSEEASAEAGVWMVAF
jgi:hypothetical protein